jgi:deoxyribodipyrimidine photo-lyase
MYENGLFLFHRDLRLTDNTGFLDACSKCHKVYCCFVFTPEQISSKNDYRSKNAIQFMLESLEDLENQIKFKGGELLCFYGNTTKIIGILIQQMKIDAVFFNRDFSPYAVKRGAFIAEKCKSLHIPCIMGANDYYLYEPGSIRTSGGGYYKKFTPFYDYVLPKKVELPKELTISSKKIGVFGGSLDKDILVQLSDIFSKFIGKRNTEILVIGGRKMGKKQLAQSLISQSHYSEKRDQFSYSTSRLSAYLKFGCLSVREVYYAFKQKYGVHCEFIRQMIWRDFFAHLLFGYPNSLTDKYGPFRWSNNPRFIEAWKTGNTGFPIVDAAMRELNHTGYMHNRGRMMVAQCLIKILLVDWKIGEQYFAEKLTDYDPASNNGNWASIFGRGLYSSPFFRVMNPWIQSAKFDRDCEYIKKWIPELADVSTKDIHRWETAYEKYKNVDYPAPITDYGEQKEKFIRLYQS